jgi:deazaflavin-dependent oxidoreductase (nitroreductase family)
LRWFLRAPIKLYDWGLGSLLGGRFLLVHHVGRKSGKPRKNVLEVVKHDTERDVYYVAVGFGEKSDWFKNLQKNPDTTIEARRRRLDVRARVLDEEEGGALMADYAKRHPTAARKLMQYCGYEVDGSDADYREVARIGLHFVAFEPRGG